MGFVGGVQIDVKENFSILEGKGQDSTGFQKTRSLPDGQYSVITDYLQRLGITLSLGMANKENLAGRKFLRVLDPAHFGATAVYRRTAHQFGERSAKGVVSEDTNEKSGFSRPRRIGWPFHKIREVCDVVGFCKVFGRDGVLSEESRWTDKSAETQGEDKKCSEAELRHRDYSSKLT